MKFFKIYIILKKEQTTSSEHPSIRPSSAISTSLLKLLRIGRCFWPALGEFDRVEERAVCVHLSASIERFYVRCVRMHRQVSGCGRPKKKKVKKSKKGRSKKWCVMTHDVRECASGLSQVRIGDAARADDDGGVDEFRGEVDDGVHAEGPPAKFAGTIEFILAHTPRRSLGRKTRAPPSVSDLLFF